MKKKIFAIIGTVAIAGSLFSANVFAAEAGGFAPAPFASEQGFGEPGMGPGGMRFGGMEPGGGRGGAPFEMTEEQKAQMEAEQEERKEAVAAFIKTLTAEQQALYEAMTPNVAMTPDEAAAAEGQPPEMLDETEMAAMQESREAFVASLTDEQKTEYNALLGRGMRGFESDADREEKMNAFIETLSDSQKAAFAAIQPSQPAEGEQPSRPDEAGMEAMKEKQDAFIATLSEEQKIAYEELFRGFNFLRL